MLVGVYKNEIGAVTILSGNEFYDLQTIINLTVIPPHLNATVHIVDDSIFPVEYMDFFDAWELDETKLTVSVNFEKAQEVTRKRLRFDRIDVMAKLDVEFQRALEISADTAAIVQEKQRLRDITNQVSACTTLQELRNLTVLNKKE